MKKNATNVPSADSTTPPPIDATFLSTVCVALLQPLLDVRRRHRQLFARDARHRADHRVLSRGAPACCRQLEVLARTYATSARAWFTNTRPSKVSGVSSAKGVRPVMMPADTPARPRSLRVSQQCTGRAGRRGRSPRPSRPRRAAGPAACRTPPGRRARRRRLLCRTPRAPLEEEGLMGLLIYVSGEAGL